MSNLNSVEPNVSWPRVLVPLVDPHADAGCEFGDAAVCELARLAMVNSTNRREARAPVLLAEALGDDALCTSLEVLAPYAAVLRGPDRAGPLRLDATRQLPTELGKATP